MPNGVTDLGSTLVHVMTCYLFCTSHYLNHYGCTVNWSLWIKVQWNFNQNAHVFSWEKATEYVVCKMSAILFRSQYVECTSVCRLDGVPRHALEPTWQRLHMPPTAAELRRHTLMKDIQGEGCLARFNLIVTCWVVLKKLKHVCALYFIHTGRM